MSSVLDWAYWHLARCDAERGQRRPVFQRSDGDPVRLRESEYNFQSAVVELAELLGWRVFHAARIKGHLRTGSSVGFLDLVLARNGVVLFAECKTDTGKLTNEQIDWLLATHGVIWRPKHWKVIEKSLKDGQAYETEPIPRMR